ncbi:MAG: M15 family metallopeptidase [Tannerellaceae bacterium]|jgi:D-alanyl-D-alanine dipeptidase|nr:M15 family metallopeptidase [Tannerellaceae bacterium]
MKQTALRLLILCLATFTAYGQNGETGDRYLAACGLVDAARMDTSLRLCLRYATPDNIMGQAVYQGISGAWLHPDAASKLLKAQQLLKARHPGYSLLIYDAARPMSVQRKMWNLVRGTPKTNYVSNPARGGGLHNYGMAVDLGIVDASGTPLPMGTPFDFFGEEAHTDREEYLLQTNKISREAYTNRLLLRNIMRQAGFRTIRYEWWHFNACSRSEAQANYRLIE